MSDRSTEEVTQAVADAISESVGELVTGWVLVAESITDEGEQAAWFLYPAEQPVWRTMGLTEYASVKLAAGE